MAIFQLEGFAELGVARDRAAALGARVVWSVDLEDIAGADARRHKVLAEIERRRDALARRLRTASDTVIDVA